MIKKISAAEFFGFFWCLSIMLEDIIKTVVLIWKQKQKQPPQLIIQTGFPFMEWECWCAAGEIFHWLMAPLSVLSSLFFLTPFFSLSEKEFLGYSEHFWHCGHCKCVISRGFSPMVTNVWWGTLATLNVKCQNVSKEHSEPTREIISDSGVSILQAWLWSRHGRQAIVICRDFTQTFAFTL